MTDNEIIKALECCFIKVDCTDCPCYEGKPFAEDCLGNVAKQSLDLINRQKAEVEAWKETAETAEKAFESWHRTAELNAKKIIELNAEIERLKKGISVDLEGYASEYNNQIKAEAIKELAERLKEEARVYDEYDGEEEYFYMCVTVDDIDNLVKEMVGE